MAMARTFNQSSDAGMASIPPPAAVDLLRMDEVLRRTGLSRSTVYRLVREGRFPRPCKLSIQTVAFRSDEVAAWIDQLPRAAVGR